MQELILASDLPKYDVASKSLTVSNNFEKDLRDYCKSLDEMRLKYSNISEIGALNDTDIEIIAKNRKYLEKTHKALKDWLDNTIFELTKDLKRFEVYLSTLKKTEKDFSEFDKNIKRLNLEARKNAIRMAICEEFFIANSKELSPDQNGEIKRELLIDRAVYDVFIDKIELADYKLTNFENSNSKLKSDKIAEAVNYYASLLELFNSEARRVLAHLQKLKSEGSINPNFGYNAGLEDNVNRLVYMTVKNFVALDEFGKVPYISNFEREIASESAKWLENKAALLKQQETQQSQPAPEPIAPPPAPKASPVKESGQEDVFEVVEVDVSGVVNLRLAGLRKDPNSLANAILGLEQVVFKVRKRKTSDLQQVRTGIVDFLLKI